MLVISLSGGSGSGKTTLARHIISRFPKGFVTLLPMDAYYKDHAHLSDDEKMKHNFDHPDAIDFELLIAHLWELKKGVPVERPVYSFITCSRQPGTFPVLPSEIVLLEGLMALNNKYLRNIADVKVFIDTTEHNRLERIVARDKEERGRTREMVEERFRQTVQPMHEKFIEPFRHYADMIIDGNSSYIQGMVNNIGQVIGLRLQHNYCFSG
jgi:uridine kinase